MDIDLPEIVTVEGNYALLLTQACTMSCSGCTYLDYKDMGNTICNPMRFDTVKEIANSVMDMRVKLSKLGFMGGEPTLHPEYPEMAKWLSQYKGILYDDLIIHTNGTNLNKWFIEALDYIDVLKFSIYPLNSEIKSEMIESGFDEYIRNKGIDIWYKEQNEFYDYENERDDIEYNQQLNWERCWAKEYCKVITKEGVFRCYITYNRDTEICDFEDRDKFIHYLTQTDEPMEACKTCPMPPKTKKWESNNSERDKKAINHGIKLIRNYRDNIYL